MRQRSCLAGSGHCGEALVSHRAARTRNGLLKPNGTSARRPTCEAEQAFPPRPSAGTGPHRPSGRSSVSQRSRPPARDTVVVVIAVLRPMLLTPSPDLPDGSDAPWSFEVKHDGIRCLAWSDGGSVRLYSRPGRDITAHFPEVAAAVLGLRQALLLDGELIVDGPEDRGDFEAVVSRLHRDNGVAAAAERAPATLICFDLLAAGPRCLCCAPLEDRRQQLRDIVGASPHLMPNPVFTDGQALFAACAARGLEGVVAKRDESMYRPGRRSADWLKVKCWRVCAADLVGIGPDGDVRFRARVGDVDIDGVVPKGMGLTPVQRRVLRQVAEAFGVCDPRGWRRLPPGLNAHIRYIGLSAGGHLRTPVLAGPIVPA